MSNWRSKCIVALSFLALFYLFIGVYLKVYGA